MIKIIFDATPMIVERTGIAYYTERLATSLAAHYPDDVELVGFYYNFLGRRDTSHLPRMKNLRYMGASLIPSKIVFQLRRWGIEIPIEFLALQRGDFVIYANFLSYPTLTGIPSAPVIHDLTYLDLPEYVSPKLRSDLVRFVPKAIQRAAFTMTVSAFSKKRIHDAYDVPLDNILVTHIPPAASKPIAATRRQTITQQNGITKPYILFVGTIDPRKNIIGLIEGFMQLPQAMRDSHQLVLIGRIERFAQAEESRLRQAISEGHNILHLGYVDDETRDALLQSATVFTTASQYEGFGMPILEAMSHGTPCAISDIPVFKEVAGDAAAYFTHNKPSSIAQTIGALLQNTKERKRLGSIGKAHAANYQWDTVAVSVYEKIRAAIGGA
jgi:glycosyltransferase involved in cell wall biosynthesis